ncbi:hypothetical protein DFJ74DRAFT_664209 [Hyaloraphidium curvatum]|nr:hypothetical protein DFJ74DRAFT_664209 [Hyaloraphidium curvatum]
MFTAHSCGPAARIEHGPVPPLDVPGAEVELSLVAIRDVAAGEVLSFDYDSTEWEMAEPFDCRCGADVCRGRVEGFKLLAARDPETARGLLKHASDHIKAMAAVEMPQLVAED